MNFRKRIFYTIAAGMLSILLLSYAMMYLYFYRVMFDETVKKQRVYVQLNQQIADSFLQSLYHTVVQMVSNQALGDYLSRDTDDPIERFQIRQGVNNLFSNYARHQIMDASFHYRSILFLSDKLPIADSFGTYTIDDNPYGDLNIIFSNASAKQQDWYQKTAEYGYYVFENKGTNELCIARRFYNNYYAGPHIPEGLAVLVVSIPMDQVARVLSSTPVTPDSGYAILNGDGVLLYCSNPEITRASYEYAWQEYTVGKQPEFTMTNDHERYLVNYCTVNYGLQLLFLTPDSDIVSGVMPLMYTYSAIFAGIMLVTLLVIYLLTRQVTSPLGKLAKAIEDIHDTKNFDMDALHVSNDSELVILENSFCHLIDNVNILIDDINVQHEKEKRSELRALQAQINPHFIFNAMDMVNWMALIRNCDDIARTVSSIANLMRYSITDADRMVALDQELTNIKHFISIYRLRHHNCLHLETRLESDSIQIPKFTLQPLVENSIRHAQTLDGEDLQIIIRAYTEGDRATIEVWDNGTGCSAEELNRHLNYEETDLKISNGFGVRNVNERIHLRFGAGSGLVYENTSDGTLIARITLNNKNA